jgi:hypothetical protein
MTLQSQERRSDQMRIVRWLQQSYIGTMSNLIGALTGYLSAITFLSAVAY